MGTLFMSRFNFIAAAFVGFAMGGIHLYLDPLFSNLFLKQQILHLFSFCDIAQKLSIVIGTLFANYVNYWFNEICNYIFSNFLCFRCNYTN